MPDDQFADVDVRRGRSVLILASAVGVVLLAAAIIGVHTWRDTAGRGPAADGATPITPSGSPSSVASLSPVGSSEPALSSAPIASSVPIVSAAPISSAAAQRSTAPAASRTSPTARQSAGDNDPNLKVTIQASPTHVVWGQKVRVTVTITSAGGVFERPVVMGFNGSDPSDNFSDARPPCSDSTGSISCPINEVLPGHKTSFTFTFIPGPFPGTDGYDDAIAATFEYTDRYGRPQQTQQYFGHVFLYDPPSSSPASSTAASATAAPSSAG